MRYWNRKTENLYIAQGPRQETQCEKTQDTVKENWSEKMLPNYQILC